MITGSIVALATPMKTSGEIDWEMLEHLAQVGGLDLAPMAPATAD